MGLGRGATAVEKPGFRCPGAPSKPHSFADPDDTTNGSTAVRFTADQDKGKADMLSPACPGKPLALDSKT